MNRQKVNKKLKESKAFFPAVWQEGDSNKLTQLLFFKDNEHFRFYKEHTERARTNGDVYRTTFFYLMGILPETRAHISELWEDNSIRLEGMEKPGAWQTSGTLKICRLAFNLYNGYYYGSGGDYVPYNIFCTPEFPYMICALQMMFGQRY